MKLKIKCSEFKQCLAALEPVIGINGLSEGPPMGVRLKYAKDTLTVSGADPDRTMKIVYKLPPTSVTGTSDGVWLIYPRPLLSWSKLLDRRDTTGAVNITTKRSGGMITYGAYEVNLHSLTQDRIPNYTAPQGDPIVLNPHALLACLEQVYGTAASPNNDKSHILSFIHFKQAPEGIWLEAADRAQGVHSLVTSQGMPPTNVDIALNQESAQALIKLINNLKPVTVKLWVSDNKAFIALDSAANLVIASIAEGSVYPNIVDVLPDPDTYTRKIAIDAKQWQESIRSVCILGSNKTARLLLDLLPEGVFMQVDSDNGSIKAQVPGVEWPFEAIQVQVRASYLADKLADSHQDHLVLSIPDPESTPGRGAGSLIIQSEDVSQYTAWLMPFSTALV